MSVNLNDSISDLLSDNSNENDSFFEYPLQAIKRTPKSNATRSTTGKSSENLFGITEEDSEQDIMSRPIASSTPVPNDNDVATDDEDLGFDPKKPKATPGKLSLFDDILAGGLSGDSKRSTSILAPTPTPTPAARGSGNREERRPAISRQSTDTTTENSNALRPKTATGRRGSSLSNAINSDPLGLFSQPMKDQTQSGTRKRGTTADWLGLSTADTDDDQATPRPLSITEKGIESSKSSIVSSAKTKQDPIPMTTPISIPQHSYDILKLNDTFEVNETNDFKVVPHQSQIGAAASTPAAQSMLQLNAVNLETRNAFTLLQQQEPKLSMATQMKQQERALLEMQHKQDTLLKQQELQFHTLLQQQVQRHKQLEESIKLQQQRINAHIQLMMTQPALPIEQSGHASGDVRSDEHQPFTRTKATTEHSEPQTTAQAALDILQIETDIRRLELEKQRLEELVANMQSKHECEIQMIVSTHKKQIEVLDEHTATLETRLRGEINEIHEHYKQKLTTIEDEHQKKKANWDTEIESLRQEHEDELRRIRSSNEETIDMLREEHKRVLESIQRSKVLEFAIVQDNNSYLDTIKAASANLTEAKSDLQDLRESLFSKLELANKEKQQELELRERRLADKEKRLQLSESSAEEEKARLMKLVSTLEQQLNALSKESGEENWQLRLKLSSLEADKAAFEREREYVREQLQRDEKRLSDLKERQIAEMQRINQELQEERRQIQVEKIKFETEQKLRLNKRNNDRESYETETAMKCAQDAIRQADAERQRYIVLYNELEHGKRELVNMETDLRFKQEKLSAELKMCSAAKHQAKDATQRARLIEQNYQEKLQALQTRIRELAEKEAFLAEDRKLLTQQRIAIKEAQSKVENRAGETDSQLKNITNKLYAVEEEQRRQDTRSAFNFVDRLLDDNIAESMQRMAIRTPPTKTITWGGDTSKQYLDVWPPIGLDDDSKSLVLNSNFEDINFSLRRKDVTEL